MAGTNVLSASANPIGRERGLVLGAGAGAGAGAEYAISRNVAITTDYDHFGKLSRAAGRLGHRGAALELLSAAPLPGDMQ